MIMQVWLIM